MMNGNEEEEIANEIVNAKGNGKEETEIAKGIFLENNL